MQPRAVLRGAAPVMLAAFVAATTNPFDPAAAAPAYASPSRPCVQLKLTVGTPDRGLIAVTVMTCTNGRSTPPSTPPTTPSDPNLTGSPSPNPSSTSSASTGSTASPSLPPAASSTTENTSTPGASPGTSGGLGRAGQPGASTLATPARPASSPQASTTSANTSAAGLRSPAVARRGRLAPTWGGAAGGTAGGFSGVISTSRRWTLILMVLVTLLAGVVRQAASRRR